MRVLLLIIVAYAMLFALFSLLKALMTKQVKVHNFENFKKDSDKIKFVKLQEDPKRFWTLCAVNLIGFILFAFVVFILVTL